MYSQWTGTTGGVYIRALYQGLLGMLRHVKKKSSRDTGSSLLGMCSLLAAAVARR